MTKLSKRFEDLKGKDFEHALREEVSLVNMRDKGAHPYPWEVVMEALIVLERRVNEQA